MEDWNPERLRRSMHNPSSPEVESFLPEWPTALGFCWSSNTKQGHNHRATSQNQSTDGGFIHILWFSCVGKISTRLSHQKWYGRLIYVGKNSKDPCFGDFQIAPLEMAIPLSTNTDFTRVSSAPPQGAVALCGAKDGAQAAENAGAMGAKLWSRRCILPPHCHFFNRYISRYIGGICWYSYLGILSQGVPNFFRWIKQNLTGWCSMPLNIFQKYLRTLLSPWASDQSKNLASEMKIAEAIFSNHPKLQFLAHQ